MSDPQNFSSANRPAISLVEESGRVQRVAEFPVARHPLRIVCKHSPNWRHISATTGSHSRCFEIERVDFLGPNVTQE